MIGLNSINILRWKNILIKVGTNQFWWAPILYVLIFLSSFKKLFIKFKQDCCIITYFSNFKRVFTCKEVSYVKVSNLYKL